MTIVTAAAPGGGAALGSPTVGVPAVSVGIDGYVVKRSRSRPGSSLGGITCATAANETPTIAHTAKSRHKPANISELRTLAACNPIRRKPPRQPAVSGNFSIVSIRSHSWRRWPIAAIFSAPNARPKRFRRRARDATPARRAYATHASCHAGRAELTSALALRGHNPAPSVAVQKSADEIAAE